MSSEKWISPPAYAESRGLGLRKVLAWIEAGELRAVNMAASRSGRPRWRISPESIEAFEASRTNPAVKTTPSKRRRGKPTTDSAVIEFY